MTTATPIISAEDAIARSLEIDDHYERREFLEAWLHGDWETVRAYLTPDLSATHQEWRAR